jgi:hypothetical protein
MPNLNVRSNGRTRAVLHNSRVTLGDGENSLFANGGTALVIHAGPDHMKSDPAGNAGDRIACGVIRAIRRLADASRVATRGCVLADLKPVCVIRSMTLSSSQSISESIPPAREPRARRADACKHIGPE